MYRLPAPYLSVRLALIGMLLLGATSAPAQEVSNGPPFEKNTVESTRAPLDRAKPFVLPRLDAPIVLDGLSDEPAWDAIAPLPLTMFEPFFGGEPTERTEIRVAYDQNYVYVAGRLYDSEPAGMRGNSLYRDRYSGDDVFSILLDTFDLLNWQFGTGEAPPAPGPFLCGLDSDVESDTDCNFSPDSCDP